MKYENFPANVFRFPFHQKKFVFLALIYLLLANSAVRSAETAQRESGETKETIKQAEKLTRRGDLQEAEKVLREIVRNDSKNSNAKLILSYVLLKQRRILEAYNLSLEVAKAEPKNSYAFAVLGVALLDAGNFRAAKTSFLNSLTLDNREALSWWGLGMLDFYENRIFKGLENLREAVYQKSEEPDFWYALAQVSARAEKYKEAAAAYNKFLQISPQTDTDRRARIKGLISFLEFLGNRQSLYNLDGAEQTSVPVKLIADRPVIQIRLEKNGEPLNFVLDTGSGISVVSDETAARLNIKAVARGGTARGIGGDGKFNIVYGFLKSVYVGDVKIRSVPVYIRKFHTGGERIDGYIGLSLISKFLTTLDYGNLTFTLIDKNTIKKESLQDDKLSLPLRLTSSGFLSGEVALEGIESPLNFIVDTGASVSVISDEVAGSKEISRFVKTEKMRVFGAAGVTDQVSSYILPSVSLGSYTRRGIVAIALDLDLINEAAGFQQAGILGGNFLKNYRLTFDFQNSKVIFIPIKELEVKE